MNSWSLPTASALGLLALVARESETVGLAVLLAAAALVGAALVLGATRTRPA
ncbi:hypothetical protein [Rubrivirga sp.]|uniref:hypothetical protein n=1 Tax=Rubrivirga sp. TaxID=1885344 RepID=UPI003C72B058